MFDSEINKARRLLATHCIKMRSTEQFLDYIKGHDEVRDLCYEALGIDPGMDDFIDLDFKIENTGPYPKLLIQGRYIQSGSLLEPPISISPIKIAAEYNQLTSLSLFNPSKNEKSHEPYRKFKALMLAAQSKMARNETTDPLYVKKIFSAYIRKKLGKNFQVAFLKGFYQGLPQSLKKQSFESFLADIRQHGASLSVDESNLKIAFNYNYKGYKAGFTLKITAGPGSVSYTPTLGRSVDGEELSKVEFQRLKENLLDFSSIDYSTALQLSEPDKAFAFSLAANRVHIHPVNNPNILAIPPLGYQEAETFEMERPAFRLPQSSGRFTPSKRVNPIHFQPPKIQPSGIKFHFKTGNGDAHSRDIPQHCFLSKDEMKSFLSGTLMSFLDDKLDDHVGFILPRSDSLPIEQRKIIAEAITYATGLLKEKGYTVNTTILKLGGDSGPTNRLGR